MPVKKTTTSKKTTTKKKVSPVWKNSSPSSLKSWKDIRSLKWDMINTVQNLAAKQLAKSYDQNGDGKFDKQDIFTLALNYIKKRFLSKK